MALRDQPYLPLYIQDFLTDEKLLECSAAATGVYIRILCFMHKSESYGKILLKQKDEQNPQQILNFANKLVKHLPWEQVVIHSSLIELVNEGVLTIEGNALIQKRMVRDNELSVIRSQSGKKGGEKTSSKDFAQGFAAPKVRANSKEFAPPKSTPNTENENEIENEYETVDSNTKVAIKKTKLAVPTEFFKKGVEVYFNFYKKQSEGIKPRFGDNEGYQLKDILRHLKTFKTDQSWEEALVNLELIFNNWSRLDLFYQKNVDLKSIYSNINNIINGLTRKSSTSQTSNETLRGLSNQLV